MVSASGAILRAIFYQNNAIYLAKHAFERPLNQPNKPVIAAFFTIPVTYQKIPNMM